MDRQSEENMTRLRQASARQLLKLRDEINGQLKMARGLGLVVSTNVFVQEVDADGSMLEQLELSVGLRLEVPPEV